MSGGEERCDSEERLSEADDEPWLRRTEAAGEVILGVFDIYIFDFEAILLSCEK